MLLHDVSHRRHHRLRRLARPKLCVELARSRVIDDLDQRLALLRHQCEPGETAAVQVLQHLSEAILPLAPPPVPSSRAPFLDQTRSLQELLHTGVRVIRDNRRVDVYAQFPVPGDVGFGQFKPDLTFALKAPIRTRCSGVVRQFNVDYSGKVTDGKGKLRMDGSGRGILSIQLSPAQRAYVMGVPVRLRHLLVSVSEPSTLAAALRNST